MNHNGYICAEAHDNYSIYISIPSRGILPEKEPDNTFSEMRQKVHYPEISRGIEKRISEKHAAYTDYIMRLVRR